MFEESEMQPASDTNQNVAQLILNEMNFISWYCTKNFVNLKVCSKHNLLQIRGIVCLVFISLVFARLKHLQAHNLYDALTQEFQRIAPKTFGSPIRLFFYSLIYGRRKLRDIPLDTVRYLESILCEPASGKPMDGLVFLIFKDLYDINLAKVGAVRALYLGQPCDPIKIQKALLDHYDKMCQLIDRIIQEL